MEKPTDRATRLERSLNERILILDGSMATQIEARALGEADYRGTEFGKHDRPLTCKYDLLSVSQPELIRSIHQEYLDAGADIITTNSFGANRSSMASYHLEDAVYSVNLAAARLAASVRDRHEASAPRFVAGTISSPVDTAEDYVEQVRGLLDGGADCLLAETVFNTRHAMAVLDAIDQCHQNGYGRIPVMLSATVTESGGLPSGESLEDFAGLVGKHGVLALGINCSFGAVASAPHLERLADIAETFVMCYPSAGLPDAKGQYADTPEAIASVLESLADRRLLNVAGGCCGTGPAHISEIRSRLSSHRPRRRRRHQP